MCRLSYPPLAQPSAHHQSDKQVFIGRPDTKVEVVIYWMDRVTVVQWGIKGLCVNNTFLISARNCLKQWQSVPHRGIDQC